MEPIEQFVGEDGAGMFPRLGVGIDLPLQGAEAADVPELVAEVAALLDLLFVEADVGALRRDADEAEAESVGAVLGDEVERVGRIAERFRELAALLVAD